VCSRVSIEEVYGAEDESRAISINNNRLRRGGGILNRRGQSSSATLQPPSIDPFQRLRESIETGRSILELGSGLRQLLLHPYRAQVHNVQLFACSTLASNPVRPCVVRLSYGRLPSQRHETDCKYHSFAALPEPESLITLRYSFNSASCFRFLLLLFSLSLSLSLPPPHRLSLFRYYSVTFPPLLPSLSSPSPVVVLVAVPSPFIFSREALGFRERERTADREPGPG